MINLSLRNIILGYFSETEITKDLAEELLNKLSTEDLVIALLDLINFKSPQFRNLLRDAVDCFDYDEALEFLNENEVFDFENDLIGSIQRVIEFNERGSKF